MIFGILLPLACDAQIHDQARGAPLARERPTMSRHSDSENCGRGELRHATTTASRLVSGTRRRALQCGELQSYWKTSSPVGSKCGVLFVFWRYRDSSQYNLRLARL